MEALTPIVTTLGNIFGAIFGALNSIPGLFPAIIGGLTAMYILSKKAAIMKVVDATATIIGKGASGGILGLIAAGAGIAMLMSAVGKAKSTDVGDVMSPAGGRTQISTKEGGLLNLSPNDDLIAAPNAISKLNNASDLSRLSVSSPNTSNAPQSKAIDILVQEMKALRADMNNGKIRTNTYLDGQKVTTGIAAASERSTRNNFTYGQR